MLEIHIFVLYYIGVKGNNRFGKRKLNKRIGNIKSYLIKKRRKYYACFKRFGTAFGGYKMMENYPVPECGPDDIILEIKAAAIRGADMKHWGVDNGYDDTNITPDQQQSVRGHEFAGEIVKVGENVKDWHIGQRVVSDNSAHVCGVCPACEQGDFLCCEHKVNLGLDNNTWGGGFSKYCKVPGEILAIHKHAIWEIPEGIKYEEACVLILSVTHTRQLLSSHILSPDRML